MIWVDLAILAVLAYAAANGWRRGFWVVLVELTGLILAAVLASFVYQPLGVLLVRLFKIVPSFADLIAYLLILSAVALLYALAAVHLLYRLPGGLLNHRFSSWTGSVLGAVRGLLAVAIGLVIFAGLPLSRGYKEPITQAAIPKALLEYSGRLQQAVNTLLGPTIQDTLNFLTVRTTSHDSVDLGFRTTDVRPDPAAEQRMLALINRERTSRGLRPLVINEGARAVARGHSRDMFARGYFSHVTPEGKDPFERMKERGVEFDAAGENLALAPTVDLAHDGLMNSPGHRANILSPDYRTVGIGIMDSGRYGLMVTQNFTD